MPLTRKRGRPHAELERLLGRVDESGAAASVPAEAHEAARDRALQLFWACDNSADAQPVVVLGYAAELLSLAAVDLAADPPEAIRLIDQLETTADVPRVALGCEVLRAGRLLGMPVDVAIEVQLALLLAFSRTPSVSLWTMRPSGEVMDVAHTGAFDFEPTREAALALLEDLPATAPNVITGVRIDRLRPLPAALLASLADSSGEAEALLMTAAAPGLAMLLDREAPPASEPATNETVGSAVERRLARLRYDLHDGPQQDVHLLAQDLALFREQLRPIVAGDPNAARLLGRLDDLDAQLVALDGDLRRLSTSVKSPFLQTGSLEESIKELTETFAARAGVTPQTKVDGSLTRLSDSQQITLLALIREALSNIRKHSDARAVQITIVSNENGVRAEVTDDGSGFDPESTLVKAGRAGRLGLVGMHERVRMLGGRTQIESRPGGPTVISATLPPWPTAHSKGGPAS